jgi:phospholipid-binding lipoprotein MlaA
MRIAATFATAILLAGCATTQGTATPGDPYEGFNRGVWGFNDALDTVAVKPVSTVYRTVTPRPARRGLSRVLANLSEPWSFVNNLLQGKSDRAVRNLGRFVVNTTIGVGGLADHASNLGIPAANEDFGQTLASWGAKDSPYIVLPLLGPSTLRDGIGSGVGFFADPWQLCQSQCLGMTFTERAAVGVATTISTRSDVTDAGVDAFLDTSLDPYTAARSAFFQRRAGQIADTDTVVQPVAGDAGAAGDGVLDADMEAALKELGAQEETPLADPQ